MNNIITNKYGEGDLDIDGYEDIGRFQFNEDVQDIWIQLYSYGDEYDGNDYLIQLWAMDKILGMYSTTHKGNLKSMYNKIINKFVAEYDKSNGTPLSEDKLVEISDWLYQTQLDWDAKEKIKSDERRYGKGTLSRINKLFAGGY